MQLFCKSCGEAIRSDDINLDRAIAKCDACHSVFSFADQFPDAQPARAFSKPTDMELPKGLQVDNWGGELRIVRSWFSWAILFLVFFCVFWDGFLVVWYAIAIHEQQIIMMLFPLLHVAVGVGLTYFCIASFVNKTWITVSMGQLTVRHGPLPWPGNRSLFTHDIEQLYVTEHIHRGKNSTSTTYRVNVKKKDGDKVKLASGLQDADQALYIEQEIEKHLNIADRPVPGEMR